jgi:hypothetical protein
MLATVAVAVTILPLHAQTLTPNEPSVAAFDVAAIKPNTSGEPEFGSYVEPGGRYTAKNVTLRTLIKTGYGVHDSQIAGGPSWMDTEHGEFGPQFRRNNERECGGPAPPIPPADGAKEPAVPLPCGADMFRPGHLAARAMTLSNILVALARFSSIDRVVVDRTGLTGKFDWEIQWTPEVLAAGAVAPSDGPSVFQAFRDQAGLKLEPRKDLVDVLVIDHVERPATD